MEEIIRRKMSGLKKDIGVFSDRLSELSATGNGFTQGVGELVYREMKRIGYNTVTKDRAGNVVGVLKGYKNDSNLALLSHHDMAVSTISGTGVNKFMAGIVTSVFTGALLKNTLLPLEGDLMVCCVPRKDLCSFGIKHLYENTMKKADLKGVILAEPSNYNVYLGSRGKMEYQISVKGKLDNDFLKTKGINMLSVMYPLIQELENLSRTLPVNNEFGSSSLSIKDITFQENDSSGNYREFRIVVDRCFTDSENSNSILKKASMIAENIYSKQDGVVVETSISNGSAKSSEGETMVSDKKSNYWKMENSHPFVTNSIQVLKENGFDPAIGYWKQIITEGSYTCGEWKIPTIGFGGGTEESLYLQNTPLDPESIERSILGKSLIIHRNAGIPSFGWCEDEI